MFSAKDLFFTPTSGAYTVSKSLRFRRSATAYLNRTPSGVGTSRRIFTVSFWVKRGELSTRQTVFSAGAVSTTPSGAMYFNTTNVFEIIGGGGAQYQLVTTQLFRDPSAWYHIVVAFDTTQATSSNRIKLYVNGSQVTAFSTATYPSLNFDTDYGNSVLTAIGSRTDDGTPPVSTLDGYLAEFNYIDGAAKTPSDFGAYDTNGIWQPAAYTGSYGTNGAYLKFTDVGTTSGSNTGYGKDFAGTNYWTTNNFGTTSTATTYDSMLDSPTNATGDIGNYAVLNPLRQRGANTISAGNLTALIASGADNTVVSSFTSNSGKYYWEVTYTASSSVQAVVLGVIQSSIAEASMSTVLTGGVGYYSGSGNKYVNGTVSTYGAVYVVGDVIGHALDLDSGTITFYRNNSSQGAITLPTGSNWQPAASNGTGSATQTLDYNFGQRPFAYTPPSGFSALNTQNLPTPTIAAGNKYFDATIYSGNGAAGSGTTQQINIAFQPDFFWIKNRTSASSNHILVNANALVTSLSSNNTDAELANGNQAANASGVIVAENGGSANIAYNPNLTGNNYVLWSWDGGGTPTVDNTAGAGNVPTAGSVKINGSNSTSALAGSIAATRLSANTSAGFSVVTYTGTGANATVGHGLGAAPSMIIVKQRNTASATGWPVYHASIGNTGGLNLNTTAATTTSALFWNNTSPDTTKFSIGTGVDLNTNTNTYVAYCFAPVAGYSAFGSFTANSSADGVFIYTGFRPRWIICKQTSGAGGNWFILDTSRNTYNVSNNVLDANLSDAERNANIWDILSNGMKMRISLTGDFIYAAFAENPFKISRAR